MTDTIGKKFYNIEQPAVTLAPASAHSGISVLTVNSKFSDPVESEAASFQTPFNNSSAEAEAVVIA